MKLWVQSNTDMGGDPIWDRYLTTLTAHLEAVTGPETSLRIEGVAKMEEGVTRSAYRRYLNTAKVITNGQRAEQEGYDAYVVIGLATMGRDELRDALSIPVVFTQDVAWPFETWLHGAFGLIAHSRGVYFRRVEQIRAAGVAGAFAPGSYLEVSEHAVIDAFEGEDSLVAALIESAAEAVRNGAEVLIPDILPVGMLLHHHGITEVHGKPILDAAGLAIRAAEMCVTGGIVPAPPRG